MANNNNNNNSYESNDNYNKEQKDKYGDIKEDIKIIKCGEGEEENVDLGGGMCLSLYDQQSKTSRYSNALIYLKNRATTNQKHATDSQKPKRREHKHKTKETHQTTKGKTKILKNEQRRNTKSPGKQGLKWQ